MQKLFMMLVTASMVLGTNGAYACAFDKDWKQCMEHCTEAGEVLYPFCALGHTAPRLER